MLQFSASADVSDALKKLALLSDKLEKRALREAVKAGSKEMVQGARSCCPISVGSEIAKKLKVDGKYAGGQLKKSIGRKLKTYKYAAFAVVGPRDGFKIQVGVRKKGKKKGQPIYVDPRKYAHLVERGSRSTAPANFLEKQMRPGGDAAHDALKTEVDKIIDEVSID